MKPEIAFKAIRRAGVPICVLESADPAATMKNCLASMNGKLNEIPVCEWDIIRGLVGINEKGKEVQAEIAPNGPIDTGNPAECLSKLAGSFPSKGICFFHNAHRFIPDASVAQAIWNLRDTFKARGATLVLLAPSLVLPEELKQDAVILSEPLPDEAELSGIVDSIVKDAGLTDAAIPNGDRPVIIDTLRGLSAFAAEQVLAMSVSKTGIDKDGLWQRKRKMIEQTPGLSVWQGGESFDDLGGLENLKSFLTRVLSSGKTPVRALLYLDEIEKSLAGSGGDTSGTSQDQLGVLLKVMQDQNLPGIILVGPPGTGKSSIAKAAGNVAGAPVIACDLGAMKGSLVGQSEQRIRAAMDVFSAVSQGKGMAIATCNKLIALPPELKRRFALGTFYMDLPSGEEQERIWPMWIKRYGLDAGQELPACAGWTGAEIRACCDVAYRCNMTLMQAAQFVVPVCKSAPDAIRQLRELASGKFISASYAGVYDMNRQSQPKLGGRQMEKV